jgi:hypothetical protein
MTGSGRPMCRHDPPQGCTRWWCTYRYGVLMVFAFAVLVTLIIVFLNRGSLLPPADLSPSHSSSCPLC